MRHPRFVPTLGRLAATLALVVLLEEAPRALAQRALPRRAPPTDASISVDGGRQKWQVLTVSLATAVEAHESLHPAGRNPFLDYRLTVTFTHTPTGTTRIVPGFFAADGDAADTGASGGNVWRAYFTPHLEGDWLWTLRFVWGPGIALDPAVRGSVADPVIDGSSGTFHVAHADPSAPGFLRKGMLEHVGEAYFRFAETGEYFLKNGAGGPENFLAYFEFDGTLGSSANSCLTGPENPERLHRFAAHALDYTGDAVDRRHTWGPDPKGENILGAVNYLASQGVNSLYFLTNTYLGDGNDVWPWVTPADKAHYDVSKLSQWEQVFAHMSERGIQLQLVLEESENDQLPASAGGLGHGLTPERRLYYREMVARFAHHHALIWVIGDESNYFEDVPTMEALASEIRSLDPYRHPIAFHGKHPCPSCWPAIPSVFDQYSPYFDFPAFEATAFQTAPGAYNNVVTQLRAGQTSSPRWAHYGDEQSLNAIPSNLDENRRKALWGSLMGGGAGVAWYPGNNVSSQYPAGVDKCDYFDLSAEDLGLFEDYFRQTRHALEIFQGQLPFTEMVANDALASPSGSQDYVFCRPEDPAAGIKAVYAVYRGTGSTTELTLGSGTHTVDWFDPRTGAGPVAGADLVGPGPQILTAPAEDPGMDWLAVVRQQ